MEAIREYLNNLFMSLPETPEVLRAKAALLEMMEDKYDELVSEGKSEKEAVGTVISEFGNLEELAEELGIERYLKKEKDAEDSQGAAASRKAGNRKASQTPPKKQYEWTFDDARDYLKYAWRHALCVAVGVALCICSPYLDSVLDAAEEAGYVPHWVAEAFGGSLLFFMVAAAVALFCTASHMRKQYGNVARYGISLDEKADRFVSQKRESDDGKLLSLRVTGIVLCIISVVPSSMNYANNILVSEIIDSSVLLFAGVGVCLIVLSASMGNRYKELVKALGNASGPGGEWSGMRSGRRGKGGSVAAAVVIGVTAFLAVICVVVFGLVFPFIGAGDEDGSAKTTEGRYSVADVREIRVELDTCDFHVERADVDEIQFQYSGGRRNRIPDVTLDADKGVLRIAEPGNRGWTGFNFNFFHWGKRAGHRSATLLIPESANVLRTDGGIRYVFDIDLGNLEMYGLYASEMKIDVDAGNVEGNNCLLAGQSRVDVDLGNVEFSESTATSLKADVDAGNFSFTKSPFPLACYELDLDVDLGDVTVNGEDMGTIHKSKADGEVAAQYAARVPVADHCQMTVEVDMGNIEVSE